MGAQPQHATCETDSEGDDSHTATPIRSNVGARRKSHSSASSVTARRDSKTDTRKRSSGNSDSGYSTGTKGSADVAASQKAAPVVKEAPQEMVPPSPKQSSRPAMEKRASSSRSDASQRSSAKSSKTPSRAASTKTRSSRSDRREEQPAEDRRSSQAPDTPRPSSKQQSVRPSPPSSRSSRAPSQSSQDMPPPASTVRPRPRGDSASRASRPNSYHAGMNVPLDPYYAPLYGSYERERGPPPSRSAYMNPVRPPLSVISPAATYPDPVANQALQRSMYDPARMGVAHRAQTEYSTASSSSSQYSARRPISYYPDQPNAHDISPVSPMERAQPPSPLRERKIVSARQPAHPPPYGEHVWDPELSGSEEGSEDDEEEDDEFVEPVGRFMPIQTGPPRAFNAHLQARGMPAGIAAHGTSPQDYFGESYVDDGFGSQSDYRSSRSRTTTGSSSSQSRRPSVASSGAGTKATTYSASSGSGGYRSQRRQSGYEQFTTTPIDRSQDAAEMYMRSMDSQAQHTRLQQPALTQESLRQAQARAIEAKRSSKGSVTSSSRVSGSRRSRTITAGEEQAVKLLIDTSAGMNLQLEGDTEGRPIRLFQKPGENMAQLVIGTGRRGDTVYNDSVGSARTNGGASKVSARTGSTRAAVSGRRERSRTVDELR